MCMACLNVNKQLKYVSIEIINDSYFKVDTLSFLLNNYKSYVINIESSDTLLLKINKDSIKTYSDFHLDVWAYFKTSKPLNLVKYQVYYDDLWGSLYEKYTITLKKDTSIYILPHFSNKLY